MHRGWIERFTHIQHYALSWPEETRELDNMQTSLFIRTAWFIIALFAAAIFLSLFVIAATGGH